MGSFLLGGKKSQIKGVQVQAPASGSWALDQILGAVQGEKGKQENPHTDVVCRLGMPAIHRLWPEFKAEESAASPCCIPGGRGHSLHCPANRDCFCPFTALCIGTTTRLS